MSEVQTHWKQDGESLVVQRSQIGIAAHVDYCKARANEGHHGLSDFKLKASIPTVVIEHYLNVNRITLREFMSNKEHIKRMVNDPALSDFRIAPGAM